MIQTLLIFICLMANSAWTTPAPTNDATSGCRSVFAANGIEDMDDYALAAAHGIHSLYLEDIREFFEPDAPEQNGIPVLNKNISAPDLVWLNSPLAGYDAKLKVFGFQVVDYIFTNDYPGFMVNGITTVEKLGHALHMQQMWERAQKVYQKLKQNPPSNAEEVCRCANDVEANNILHWLSVVGNNLKGFGDEIPRELVKVRQLENVIVPPELLDVVKIERSKMNESLPKHTSVDQNQMSHHKGGHGRNKKENGMPNSWRWEWIPGTVNGSKGYTTMKTMLLGSMMEDDEVEWFAHFMYCKLNHKN